MIDYPAIHMELFVSPMRVQDRCHQFGRFVLDDLDERQIESLVEHFDQEMSGVRVPGGLSSIRTLPDGKVRVDGHSPRTQKRGIRRLGSRRAT